MEEEEGTDLLKYSIVSRARFNDNERPFLYDSGSVYSMINWQTAIAIGVDMNTLEQPPLNMISATNTKFAVRGVAEVRVEIGGIDDLFKFVIVEDSPVQILVGADIIEKSHLEWDTLAGGLAIRHADGSRGPLTPVKLYTGELNMPKKYPIHAASAVVIPPRTTMKVTGKMSQLPAFKECLVTPEFKATNSHGFHTPFMVSERCGNRLDVLLSNFGTMELHVPKGALIAGVYAEKVEVVNVDWDKVTPVEPIKATSAAPSYNIDATLDATLRARVEEFLRKEPPPFAENHLRPGTTDLTQHTIETTSETPIHMRNHRYPPSVNAKIQEMAQHYRDLGLVRDSKSAWSFPVVLVKKKDGTMRFCVDYRGLNEVTKKDSYPLPRIDDTLDALAGCEFFTTLDLASGYWQIPIKEEDKHKTAFYAGALYEFNVLPMGLINAPATFQRLMETVLSGLTWRYCLCYLNDIVVFSKTFEEHCEHLKTVFDRLRSAGLSLRLSKCKFFYRKTEYLGHIISSDGIRVSDDKIKAVRDAVPPKNVKELQRFLGLANYYRRFVPHFAHMAEPLNGLLRKDVPWSWGDVHAKLTRS